MARITGGEGKGRHLVNAPKSRPTPARAREALFNILAPELPDAFFCEAFAGGGSIGVEALLRGAKTAVLIDISFGAVRSIRQNLERTGFNHLERETWRNNVGQSAIVWQQDFYKASRHPLPFGEVDVCFLDPPWSDVSFVELFQAIADCVWWKPDSLIVLEHPFRVPAPDLPGFETSDRRRYGDVAFTMWRKENSHL
ncbi:MAG: RsmD family RNA methyltransferase [bacterium]|nr:RsmD family RNA methyltransferase [bacterium]